MKKQTYSLVLLASIVTLVGFAIGRATAPAQQEVEIVEISAPNVTNGNGISTAKMDLLAKQLSDAQAKITELNEQIDHLLGEDLPTVAATETPVAEARQPREGWEARMERVKTEDPDRYAEMMAQREERARMRTEFLEERKRSEDDRDNFFANVNIAYMPKKEQEALATFIGEYQELRNLVEKRMQGERPNMEEAAQLGMSVLAKTTEIRASLLKATGKEMGFNDKESVEFATTINDIFGATSLMGPGGATGMMQGMGRWNRGRGR